MYPLDTKALKCYMKNRMHLNIPHKKSLSEILKGYYILKAFRFLENLADLFFLLLRHKLSSTAYANLVNFNPEKRGKKEQKIRKPRCFEYIFIGV
jgi:hypothetical protein